MDGESAPVKARVEGHKLGRMRLPVAFRAGPGRIGETWPLPLRGTEIYTYVLEKFKLPPSPATGVTRLWGQRG